MSPFNVTAPLVYNKTIQTTSTLIFLLPRAKAGKLIFFENSNVNGISPSENMSCRSVWFYDIDMVLGAWLYNTLISTKSYFPISFHLLKCL